MRFSLDEDLSPVIATIARSLGLEVASAQEDGRGGIEDIDMLLFAADEGGHGSPHDTRRLLTCACGGPRWCSQAGPATSAQGKQCS